MTRVRVELSEDFNTFTVIWDNPDNFNNLGGIRLGYKSGEVPLPDMSDATVVNLDKYTQRHTLNIPFGVYGIYVQTIGNDGLVNEIQTDEQTILFDYGEYSDYFLEAISPTHSYVTLNMFITKNKEIFFYSPGNGTSSAPVYLYDKTLKTNTQLLPYAWNTYIYEIDDVVIIINNGTAYKWINGGLTTLLTDITSRPPFLYKGELVITTSNSIRKWNGVNFNTILYSGKVLNSSSFEVQNCFYIQPSDGGLLEYDGVTVTKVIESGNFNTGVVSSIGEVFFYYTSGTTKIVRKKDGVFEELFDTSTINMFMNNIVCDSDSVGNMYFSSNNSNNNGLLKYSVDVGAITRISTVNYNWRLVLELETDKVILHSTNGGLRIVEGTTITGINGSSSIAGWFISSKKELYFWGGSGLTGIYLYDGTVKQLYNSGSGWSYWDELENGDIYVGNGSVSTVCRIRNKSLINISVGGPAIKTVQAKNGVLFFLGRSGKMNKLEVNATTSINCSNYYYRDYFATEQGLIYFYNSGTGQGIAISDGNYIIETGLPATVSNLSVFEKNGRYFLICLTENTGLPTTIYEFKNSGLGVLEHKVRGKEFEEWFINADYFSTFKLIMPNISKLLYNVMATNLTNMPTLMNGTTRLVLLKRGEQNE